jgi:transposase
MLLAGDEALSQVILPILNAWQSLRSQAADLSYQLIATARQSPSSQLLMSIPGVGAVTATLFVSAIENPENFSKSRSVGSWLGLTTRRYQSGEVADVAEE